MQVDGLSISLSPREVASLLRSFPLPKGIQVGDVVLTDSGIEATVKASLLLGLPLKFKVEIDHFAGSKLFLKVSPPVKPNWLLVRPLVLALPGASYAGNSVIELDLVSSSRGYLSGLTLKRVVLNKSGFTGEVAGISVNTSWEDMFSKISW
jgi:hypothetical protein